MESFSEYVVTGIETTIKGLNLKISPKLVIVLNLESLDAKNNNVSTADIKKLKIWFWQSWKISRQSEITQAAYKIKNIKLKITRAASNE